MADASPQMTSPASTQSSHASYYFPIQDSAKPEKISPFASPFASSYFRQQNLFPNRINVEDSPLSEEQWSRYAFAFGMPAKDIHRPHPDARKFTQRLLRKPSMSDKQLTELLLPLIQTSTHSSKTLSIKTDITFHLDAVPHGDPAGRVSQNAAWCMPLPTPRPNIIIGFSSKNFTQHELALQDGIISNAHGEPCNLAKISQPCVGNNTTFWPFFTVEVQGESSHAAQNAAAGSASTCNNALALLTEAAEKSAVLRHGRNVFWQSRKVVQSFSLSIHNGTSGRGKMATLNLHTSQGGLYHTAAPIRSYALCNEYDLECLLVRLCSIFVWAENCHLQQIFTLLANLDALVQLETRREYISGIFPSIEMDGVADFYGSMSAGRRKRGIIKSVISDLSPRWIRAN